jgi:diguanylate cyclase (GGDEF)-like protein
MLNRGVRVVGDLLLGGNGKQRLRTIRTLQASAVGAVQLGILLYGLGHATVPVTEGRWLIAILSTGMIGFYGAFRLGMNQRARDPSLVIPQIGFALTCTAGAYAMTGPIHGALLMMVATALLFGAFNMRARQINTVCAWTLAGFGALMSAMPWVDPVRYSYPVELFHFLICAITLPVVASVGGQMSEARLKGRRLNADLRTALERIDKLATRDELTGLINRRQMKTQLMQEAARRSRTGGLACVCLMDLDLFKSVNDRLGHAAGDDVLRSFGEVFANMVRQSDSVARWGGEEFLWLMPETTLRDAEAAVERVRSALTSKQLSTDHPQLTITFSAGLALVMTDESFERCIERADAALYAAKAGGRNQTAVSGGAAPANIGAVAVVPQITDRGCGHSVVSPTAA